MTKRCRQEGEEEEEVSCDAAQLSTLVLGSEAAGGRNRLCRQPTPEEVCFNADKVPVEAAMLICPHVKRCRTSAVEEGKCTMKTRKLRPREGEDTAQRKRTGSKHGVFFIPTMPMPLHC